MKTVITKYAVVCLLLYAAVLSIVMFWQTENILMGVWAVLAAVGWVAWGFERFTTSDDASNVAVAVTPPGPGLKTAKAASVGAQPVKESVPEEVAPVQVSQMAEQVRATLDQAEQAVSLSIKTFKHITTESKELAQTAREMMNWGSEKSPLIHSALAHLSERSEHISGSAQEVITGYQYHDVMRQRLEGIAAYLDTLEEKPHG